MRAVGLGGLGIVTSVTLNLLPTFKVAQSVYENLSLAQLKEDHARPGVFGSGFSVSLFTDWQNHQATEVWIKRKLAPGDKNDWQPEFFGARLATKKLHPIDDHPAESCTEQQGIPGPWYERLPHFRMNFTPSSGRELQTEYFVPRERGYEAILAVEKLRDQITPHLFITELRTIAADNLWMSTAYQRDSLAIHFTWKPEWPGGKLEEILPQIEKQLEPFDARPHWAKLFTLSPSALQSRYALTCRRIFRQCSSITIRKQSSATSSSAGICIRAETARVAPRNVGVNSCNATRPGGKSPLERIPHGHVTVSMHRHSPDRQRNSKCDQYIRNRRLQLFGAMLHGGDHGLRLSGGPASHRFSSSDISSPSSRTAHGTQPPPMSAIL